MFNYVVERNGSLRLDLFDACGDALGETVDVFLHNQTLSDTVAVRGFMVRKPFVITSLLSAPHGLYRLHIDPPSYLPVSTFVNIASDSKPAERSLPFVIDPGKVVDVKFPDWRELGFAHPLLEASTNVIGHAGVFGRDLFDRIDTISKAGLLNILAKCRRTPLESGQVVLDFVQELRELRGDRFFAVVPKHLREHVKNGTLSGLFHEVNGSLHRPPDGFSLAGSYKTPDRYGNLQLTFFASGDNWMADIDIDDAAGVEHVFQVLRNAVTGKPTHPYYIRDILLRHQEIDPGYRFIVHQPAARRLSATQKA